MPTVEIAYNPNDFYYTSSKYYNNELKSGTSCETTYLDEDTWNANCCNDKLDKTNCQTWNPKNCYEFELCKNKKYADLANDLENKNSGTSERHANLQKQYQTEIIKTINVSASIMLITYLSVYFFK